MRLFHGIVIVLMAISLCTFTHTLSAQANIAKYIGKQIQTIDIEGLKKVTKEEILFALPFRTGDVLQSNSIDLVISILYKTGYFKSIDIDVKDTDKNGIAVIITVIERELVEEIIITGNNKLWKDKIIEKIPLKAGDFYSKVKINECIKAINNYYIEEGYEAPEINVTDTVKKENGNIIVTFALKEAKRILVKEIVISGLKEFKDFQILEVMETKTQALFIFEWNKGLYKEGVLESDLIKIKQLYWTKGYLDVDVRISEKKINETESEKQMTIVINIVEGEQYTITELRIEGNKILSTEELLKDFDMKTNQIYDRMYYKNLQDKIRFKYASIGYLVVRIQDKEIVDYTKRTVILTLTVNENFQAHIEKIIVKGNTKTKDYVIMRELLIKEGETFNAEKLQASIINLYNTQYYGNVDVQYKEGTEEGLVDIIIIIEERDTGQIKFGASWTPGVENGFGLNAGITEPNFLGYGVMVSAEIIVSIDNYKLSLGYTDRWFLGLPIIFGGSINGEITKYSKQLIDTNSNNVPDGGSFFDDTLGYSEYENFINTATSEELTQFYDTMTTNYYLDTISLSLTYGKRWIPYYELVSYFDFKIKHYRPYDVFVRPFLGQDPDEASEAFQQYASGNTDYWSFDNSLTVLGKYDTTDYKLLPTKGLFAKVLIEYAGGIFGGDDQYIKLNFGFNFNQYLVWDFIASFNMSIYFMLPQLDNSLSISPENNLRISGYNEIRGWITLPLIDNPYLTKGIFSFEIQRDLASRILSATLFFDFGYMLKEIDYRTLTIQDVYGSVGFGIKLQMPQLPLRLYLTKPFKFDENGTMQFMAGDNFWSKWTFVFTVGDIFTF